MIDYENLSKSNAQFISELKEVATRVINNGWYVLGQEVASFEQEFSAYLGAKHCIGVANGLDALILSIEALNFPKGSDILVASNTYIATILAIVRSGHHPVLVEPDIETYNLSPKNLAGVMTKNTRAICVTHLFGKACRMDEVTRFANDHGLRLIEDCAQSHGAQFAGQMTGTFGDAGCFSFYPTKNLGAIGDAGAIATNDDELADRLRHLRNYGSKEKYVNEYVGANSRLDELQAAFLRVKLRYLDEMTSYKRALAKIYFEELPDWVTKPICRLDEFDVFHIYAIRHPQRDLLKSYLLAKGIKTEIHYPIPPHRQKAMSGIISGDYPVADKLHKTELSLPISIGNTPDEIHEVCIALNKFMQGNT